jgi:SPP1 family predicted phage head-tail adaptor
MAEPKIGELNRRITLQNLTQTKDSEGGLVDTWADFATNIWASIDNYSGNEPSITKYGGLVGVARVLFKMRYIAGVNSIMRVVYDNKYYAIKHVSNWKEKNKWLYLDCEIGKNQGH